MEIILAIVVGIFYSSAVYLMLRRSILKFIIGLIFMINATNLLVFMSAGLVSGSPAYINFEDKGVTEIADPLPQAIILTSIVIGLGIVVFTLALKFKFFEMTGTDDLDQLKKTDN